MIPLDIFKEKMHNKPIETPLEAWLTFLSEDNPEKMIELIEKYPQFKAMYETLYLMCQNTERVMEMFSEELRILDKNTVKYMIEEQQKEIDRQREELSLKREELIMKNEELTMKNEELTMKNEELTMKNEELDKKEKQLVKQTELLEEKDSQITKLKQELEQTLAYKSLIK